MQISTRLSITFSIIVSFIFIAFGMTVYSFSSDYRARNFQERLRGRVEITEKIFLEKESFSAVELKKINNQFLHTLPQETEEVQQIQTHQKFTFKHDYPQRVRDQFLDKNTFEFKYSETQGMSRIFHVKGKDHLIIVTAFDSVGLQYLSYLRNIIFILVLIGAPFVFIGSFLITKRALRPLSKKIDAANSISASNLHQRLEVSNPNDEIGKVAIAFNKLLDRLEASFEAQKSFIRNASHEIRNPLTAIIGEAEVTIGKPRIPEVYVRSLNTILSEAEILNATVNNLLQLSKVAANEEKLLYETIQFDRFLKEVKESFDFLIPENQIELVFAHTGPYAISGNKSLLKTTLINLLDNACKFSSNNRVEVALSKDNDWLSLTIKDTGIGIANADLKKIITPFYRGNNALQIKGSGIGLSLSSRVMDLHQGTLAIESQINKGTEVLIKLPICPK